MDAGTSVVGFLRQRRKEVCNFPTLVTPSFNQEYSFTKPMQACYDNGGLLGRFIGQARHEVLPQKNHFVAGHARGKGVLVAPWSSIIYRPLQEYFTNLNWHARQWSLQGEGIGHGFCKRFPPNSRYVMDGKQDKAWSSTLHNTQWLTLVYTNMEVDF